MTDFIISIMLVHVVTGVVVGLKAIITLPSSDAYHNDKVYTIASVTVAMLLLEVCTYRPCLDEFIIDTATSQLLVCEIIAHALLTYLIYTADIQRRG